MCFLHTGRQQFPGLLVPLLRGPAEPFLRLDPVLLHAVSPQVAKAQFILYRGAVLVLLQKIQKALFPILLHAVSPLYLHATTARLRSSALWAAKVCSIFFSRAWVMTSASPSCSHRAMVPQAGAGCPALY